MCASPFASSLTRPRLSRASIILPIFVMFLLSEPAGAQSCYRFSDAHGDTQATVTATFPIASIPASFVPPGQGEIDFTAAFSSAQGLDGTRVSYSPTHVATIIHRGTSHTFNTFVVTIGDMRRGTTTRVQRLELSSDGPGEHVLDFHPAERGRVIQSVSGRIHGDTASLLDMGATIPRARST